MKFKGFTYIEVIITIAIFIIAFALGSLSLNYFFNSNAMNTVEDRLISSLRVAKTNSERRIHNSSWGIYFYDNTNEEENDSFTFFNGSSYAGRDQSFDDVFQFPLNINYSSINLNGGGSEVVFTRSDGYTDNYGDIIIQNSSDQLLNININKYGQIISN